MTIATTTSAQQQRLSHQNIIKINVLIDDHMIGQYGRLTWEVVDDVLGALNTWGKRYGFGFVMFHVFDGEGGVASGYML